MKAIALAVSLAGLLAAAPPRIADPEGFVAQVLHAIAANPRDYMPPEQGILTPRLQALFDRDRRKAKKEVGCLDGDFWTDSQDPDGMRDIRVSSRSSTDPNRRTVVATFTLEHPKEMEYEFRRINGRWLLDDVSSRKEPQWRLSTLLHCQ